MVMALQLRTSDSFLASDLLQLVAARTQSAVRHGFVQRMGPPRSLPTVDHCASVRPLPFTAIQPATDRVGFEPTVPLRAHRFSRPAVSTAHAPVHDAATTTATARSATAPPTLLQQVARVRNN